MIKDGHVFTTSEAGQVRVGKVTDYDVELTIYGMYFGIQGIKELRKFLKKLQRQLEEEAVGE